MKTLLTLLMLWVPISASAAIYRWVDAEGTIHFSDQKPNRPDVVEVEVSPPNVISTEKPQPGAAPAAPSATPAKVPPRYQSLTIVTPANDAAVRANDGVVNVQCRLDPPLGVTAGHEVRIVVDGKVLGGLKTCGTTLTQMNRGTHTLQIQVVDSLGKVLISSPAQTFHVLKASRL